MGMLPRIVMLVMVVALACGCETKPEESAGTGKPVVGVLVYWQDDIYINLVTESIKQAFDGKAEVEILDAKNDQLLQNEQIDRLIAKRISALAVNIVDTQSAGKAVDAIQKAGIPVVFFNREPDLNNLKGYSKASFVGTTVSDAGTMQGDIIKDLWDRHPEYDRNKDGRCQYLMIQANLDNPEALARTEYSVKEARDKGLNMQQVGETLLCNWDEKLAHEAVQLMFPVLRDKMELIIANNDAMALGAVRALNEFGFNLEGGEPADFIPVVGVDAVPGAIAAIQQGKMSGTVVQDGDAMGRAVAGMVMNAVNGKDFLDGMPYSWDDSGIAIRIPYAPYTNER